MARPKKTVDAERSAVMAAAAGRMRAERIAEGFSQDALAAAIGITRAALTSYEGGVNPLPLAVAIAWCQGLDANPRWLASGAEPRRPFPPFEELEITQETLLQAYARRDDFLTGYQTILAGKIERWVKQNPTGKLIERSLAKKGGEIELRRMSKPELYKRAHEALRDAERRRGKTSPHLNLLFASHLIDALAEREKREAFTKRVNKSGQPPTDRAKAS